MTNSMRIIAAIGVVAATSTLAGAQGSEPSRPPRAPQQEFKFPHVSTHTLSNGLRVYVVEDHSAQVVAVRAVFGVDSTFDPPGKEGLYQVTFGALREGTTSRSAAQLAEASARIGSIVAPTAFTTIPSRFDAALSLMADMLMNPSFDAAGIDRRKAAVAGTFRTINSRAATAPRALMYALLDGRDDALARSQYATDAGVATITPADVKGFYDSYIGPKTMSLVVAGDVSDANALAEATKVFGRWDKSAAALRPASNPPAPRPTTIYLRDIPGAATYIYAGNMGPSRNAPDAFAAEALSAATSIHLLQTLRERRSFIYAGAVAIWWKPAPRRSEFFGSTTLPAGKADSALVEWLGMLRGFRGSSPIGEMELRNAVNARVGALFTKTDGPDSVATRIAEAVRDNLPPDFLAQYAAGLTKVTPADVVAAAQKYIDVDHLVIVVTGDRKVLEPLLRAANIAPVVVVDANGKPEPSGDGR